jgi:hypothetical protein
MDAAILNSPLGELDAALFSILNGTFEWSILDTHPSPPDSGYYLYVYVDDVYWQDSDGNTSKLLYATDLIHAREEQVAGTDGGDFTQAAWRTRTLNTLSVDTTGDAVLAANQLTVPAGTWDVWGRAPAYRVTQHQARLYDITNADELLSGLSNFTQNLAFANVSEAVVVGRVTFTEATVVELQHQCATTRAADGFGIGAGVGTEVFAELILRRAASD